MTFFQLRDEAAQTCAKIGGVLEVPDDVTSSNSQYLLAQNSIKQAWIGVSRFYVPWEHKYRKWNI